jgi:hypothetical protein
MENAIIKPMLGAEIITWVRYVDDIFCIIEKDKFDYILNKINSFDTYLKFTHEYPSAQNELPFLDTLVYVNSSGSLEHRFYRKPTSSPILNNFSEAIMPKKYLMSVLCGEIHRHYNTNSNADDLEQSLAGLEDQFISNGYPQKLIRSKIREIKARNFQPRPKPAESVKIPNSSYTIVLPFTSHRCENVSRKIIRALKKVTPKYKVNFAYQLCKVGQVVTPRLKSFEPLVDTINLIYQFTCDCSTQYIGETYRRLKTRAKEHGQPSRDSEISRHIFKTKKEYACSEYEVALNSFLQSYTGSATVAGQKQLFHLDHYKVVANGLSVLRQRKNVEAVKISKYQPVLNKQVAHRKVKLL